MFGFELVLVCVAYVSLVNRFGIILFVLIRFAVLRFSMLSAEAINLLDMADIARLKFKSRAIGGKRC